MAATLVRGADAAAPVGLVLLAVAGLPGGARIGGLLAVGLTAPHVLGPLLARRLDRARDARLLLAASFAGYAVALAAAALLLGSGPLTLAAAAVVAAGACGPLLTGGLSSRLPAIAARGATASPRAKGGDGAPGEAAQRRVEGGGGAPGEAAQRRVEGGGGAPRGAAQHRAEGGAPGEAAQRRAQSWDALTYGVGGTAGPGAVAALAGLAGPLAAVLALSGCAAAGAALTLTLPRGAAAEETGGPVPPVRTVLQLVAARGPLRRVTVASALSAASIGAVPAVIAVVLGAELHGSGATLSAAFGAGTLAGALLLIARPLRGEPELLTLRAAGASGAALALCALAPSYPLAVAAFVVAGFVDAPLVTATLTARAVYAPAGARAQVFVTVSALKVAAAAGGSALAAAAIGSGPRVLLAAGAAVTLAGALGCALERAAGRTGAGRPAPVVDLTAR